MYFFDHVAQLSGKDFEGGAFTTLKPSASASSKTHLSLTDTEDDEQDFHGFGGGAGGMGDALVFVSHKFHSVTPVTSGKRSVLVLEFWEGDEKKCNHRCNRRQPGCPLQRQPEAAGAGVAEW